MTYRHLNPHDKSPCGVGTVADDMAIVAEAVYLRTDGPRFPIPNGIAKEGETELSIAEICRRQRLKARKQAKATRKITKSHEHNERIEIYGLTDVEASEAIPYDRVGEGTGQDIFAGCVRLMTDIFGLDKRGVKGLIDNMKD